MHYIAPPPLPPAHERRRAQQCQKKQRHQIQHHPLVRKWAPTDGKETGAHNRNRARIINGTAHCRQPAPPSHCRTHTRSQASFQKSGDIFAQHAQQCSRTVRKPHVPSSQTHNAHHPLALPPLASKLMPPQTCSRFGGCCQCCPLGCMRSAERV